MRTITEFIKAINVSSSSASLLPAITSPREFKPSLRQQQQQQFVRNFAGPVPALQVQCAAASL